MKNLILGAILLFSVMTFGQKRHAGTTASAQPETTVDTTATKSKWSKYVGVGLSISNGNSYENNDNTTTFDMASYPSVEFGFSRENLSLGFVLGRTNLRGLGQSSYNLGADTDNLAKYYWEVKAVPSFPLGVVNASLIFGAGSYFSNDKGNTFIEYGTGISYTVDKFTYGVCYSNWDGIDYITPNISYCLD
jgi:hypothetical protein